MPLYQNAEPLIRGNFGVIKRGKKPRRVAIGYLSEDQLESINAHRGGSNMDAIESVILFQGRHVFESRVDRDGYTEEDVIKQIFSALAEESVLLLSPKMTVLQNPQKRDDGYGSRVNDQCVLECTSRYPRAELYSVIPKGDRKPLLKAERPPSAALLEEEVTNSPG